MRGGGGDGCDGGGAAGGSALVKLCVGGMKYITSLSTLAKAPTSMLYLTACGGSNNAFGRQLVDEDFVFIDRCGSTFGYILNYLRGGSLPAWTDEWRFQALVEEADFFGLEELKAAAESRIEMMRAAAEDEAKRSRKREEREAALQELAAKGGITIVVTSETQAIDLVNSGSERIVNHTFAHSNESGAAVACGASSSIVRTMIHDEEPPTTQPLTLDEDF